jgi:predicted RNA binding protein YcfA (HicA-like mRNA interferase family)
MTPALPVVSGAQLVAALERVGYRVVRQKGSHVRLRADGGAKRKPVTVPLHREVKAGLLGAILRDAGLSPGELQDLL